MSVIVVGINHRTAPLEMLERLTVPPAGLPKALGALAAEASLDEVVVLSTCMRTEVYATAERFHPAVQDDPQLFVRDRLRRPPKTFATT